MQTTWNEPGNSTEYGILHREEAQPETQSNPDCGDMTDQETPLDTPRDISGTSTGYNIQAGSEAQSEPPSELLYYTSSDSMSCQTHHQVLDQNLILPYLSTDQQRILPSTLHHFNHLKIAISFYHISERSPPIKCIYMAPKLKVWNFFQKIKNLTNLEKSKFPGECKTVKIEIISDDYKIFEQKITMMNSIVFYNFSIYIANELKT